MSPAQSAIFRHFSELHDPRRTAHNTKRHKLLDVIVIAVCSALCGIDDFEHMEVWANERISWLQSFLELPGGIPSHDTINRIFAKIDPKKFQECFISWMGEASKLLAGEVVPIDGKTVRGSFDRASSKSAIHMVSAWASENGVVLGQLSTDEKSNEITAIPRLLAALELKGCLVTIDAMGAQREIASKILEAGADYTLALKGNQKSLHKAVIAEFSATVPANFEVDKYLSTVEKKHGRSELRQYFMIESISELQISHEWPGLQSIGLVRSIRLNGASRSVEDRYFLNSYGGNIAKFADAVRKHWQIENKLHWCLDVSLFNEDKCRVRIENAAENLAVLRHMALNLHKKNPQKGSMKTKKMKCIMNTDQLLKTLIS
jgi:predicted transposase YbfD/YdcC